jgi:homopolymeric O-antigen transport system ATP-binding protein
MKPIVTVENISKRYHIGGLDAGYATFRETLAAALVKPIKRLRGIQNSSRETIWALKDINFDVQEGEVVGLIGDNGAGKSTLLKILSRITTPTTGRTEVHGRIGSLLEVGTGFHPDLTGRENVFLNGTILGISRGEIARRFVEIVAFSEIEKFIDTPVKWYSSGMYLRLAFSVAVHLDTEVLIMDEVLAVGDVSFQQKCLDKMHEIRNQGRTILFVSHSMAAVTRLCERVILLDKGHLIADGPAHEVVNDYLGSSWKVTSERKWPTLDEAPGNDVVRLLGVRARNEGGETSNSVSIQEPIGIELTYEVLQPGYVLTPKVDMVNEGGIHLFASHDVGPEWRRQPRPAGRYVSTIWIPGNFLSAGNLLINASLLSHYPATVTHVYVPKAVTFQVLDNHDPGTARGDYVGPIPGVVRPLLDWTTEYCNYAEVEQILTGAVRT